MSNKLVDMELDEISLVKKGANQFSTVSIAKSLSSEEEEMEELFDENGDLVDAEELDYGDVVFDSDGNAFEVTPEDDDDDYEGEDDEEFGKSSAMISNAVRRGARGGNKARNKYVQTLPARRAWQRTGQPVVDAASNAAKATTNAAGRASDRVRSSKLGLMGQDFRSGFSQGRTQAAGLKDARGYWNKALPGRGNAAERRMRVGDVRNVMNQTLTGGRGAEVGAHVGRNAGRYAAGAGTAAVGGAGYGAYEYNRRRNVGKSLREEFSKALTDDDRESVISKAMDAISQLEEQNEIALEIAKSEQEQRIFNDYVSIAKTYDLPFEDDVVASAMMEAEANLSEEACAVIAKSFELASNLITQEIGYDELGSDAMYIVDDALDEIGKSGDPEAITQLLENNPELYEAYLAEKN